MVGSATQLGVGVVGIGWCASQHIVAFRKNPHVEVRMLCGRDEQRVRSSLERNHVDAGPAARITTRFEDLLESPDIHIIDIATPNNLHAEQAVAAARAGKHILLEKPTGLTIAELCAIREAVRTAGVRTIVSFESHYNPYIRFVHWLRTSGRLGRVQFARVQYISRILDWYPGWGWCHTKCGGGSHLLAAGCHAVDAIRWLSGLEPVELSAFHTRITAGYEWPTTILVNLRFPGGVLGHVTSTTDFQVPYTFGVEIMGEKASVRDTLIAWSDTPVDLEELAAANPIPEVHLHPAAYGSAGKAIRIEAPPPDSADVTHHPFKAEIDELVDAVRFDRETHINVIDAERTMRICIAADQSAACGGMPVELRFDEGERR
jgi:predicted dehydrogenase